MIFGPIYFKIYPHQDDLEFSFKILKSTDYPFTSTPCLTLSQCLRLHTGQHFAASNLISLQSSYEPIAMRTQMELAIRKFDQKLRMQPMSIQGPCNWSVEGAHGATWRPHTLACQGYQFGQAFGDLKKTSRRFPPFTLDRDKVKITLEMSIVMSAHLDSMMSGRL